MYSGEQIKKSTVDLQLAASKASLKGKLARGRQILRKYLENNGSDLGVVEGMMWYEDVEGLKRWFLEEYSGCSDSSFVRYRQWLCGYLREMFSDVGDGEGIGNVDGVGAGNGGNGGNDGVGDSSSAKDRNVNSPHEAKSLSGNSGVWQSSSGSTSIGGRSIIGERLIAALQSLKSGEEKAKAEARIAKRKDRDGSKGGKVKNAKGLSASLITRDDLELFAEACVSPPKYPSGRSPVMRGGNAGDDGTGGGGNDIEGIYADGVSGSGGGHGEASGNAKEYRYKDGLFLMILFDVICQTGIRPSEWNRVELFEGVEIGGNFYSLVLRVVGAEKGQNAGKGTVALTRHLNCSEFTDYEKGRLHALVQSLAGFTPDEHKDCMLKLRYLCGHICKRVFGVRDNVTMYDARHLYAAEFRRSGLGDKFSLAAALGHTDIVNQTYYGDDQEWLNNEGREFTWTLATPIDEEIDIVKLNAQRRHERTLERIKRFHKGSESLQHV